jgi:hypothetical protein
MSALSEDNKLDDARADCCYEALPSGNAAAFTYLA